MAPAGTPHGVLDLLSYEIAAVVDIPEVQKAFVSQGLVPERDTPEQYAKFIDTEIASLRDLVKKAGIASE